MVTELKKDKCTGCGVCETVCPKSCIELKSDEKGFEYPEIDFSECVKCNKCDRFCHAQNLLKNETGIVEPYAAYNKDESIRKSSSSGGIFWTLCEKVLESKGVVYGVVTDEKNQVKHTRAACLDDAEKMRGSKYVQSKISSDIFESVKSDLENNCFVLFSGTPCQIGALNRFLGKDYDSLLKVSFICHGVPSPYVFKKYISWQENIHKAKVADISFRYKDRGWTDFSMKLSFSDGSKYSNSLNRDPYLQVFLKNLCLRASCYECKYKGEEILSSNIDIMLADKWGNTGSKFDKINDDKGLSLIFLFSKKAKEIFKAVSEKLLYEKADFNIATNSNIAFFESAKRNPKQNEFYKDLNILPFDKLYKKYAKTPTSVILKSNVKKYGFKICKFLHINKLVKKIIKR